MIGKQIGRYQIEGELGRGGMGVVYRATQVTLNRTVAVKMLPDHMAESEEYLSRFRREAETLARLQHPNIVHIYDVEEVEGSHFIIMEFVDGPSLTDLVRSEGRLDPARARDVAHALADGLGAAHRKGIVHRDVKPDNILFTSEGRPKLTDFGVAHMRDSNVRTQTGVMLGTPYYMSPEQAGGKPVTAASDIYSLGVVLYEMLSGRVPFDADTPVAVALKHLKEAPPPVGQLVPDLPDALARIVDRTLAKDAGERFRSCGEFQRSLAAIEFGSGGPQGVIRATSESRCGACGTAIHPDFMACPSCGVSIQVGCDGCGQLFDAGLASCPTCGAPAPEDAEVGGVAEGLAAGLEGFRSAGRALADAVDGALKTEGATQTNGSTLRRFLPAKVAGLPTPMLAGFALVGLALLLLLIQAIPGGARSAASDPPTGPAGALASAPSSSSSDGAAGVGTVRRTVRGSEAGGTPTIASRPESASPTEAEREPPSSTPDTDDATQTPDATPPETDGATRQPDETRSASEPPAETRRPTAPVLASPVTFDEVESRSAILAIVERQTRATRTGNVQLFLRDLVPSIRAAQRGDFDDMVEVTDARRSTVGEVKIDFDDTLHATVELQVTLEVQLGGESTWTTAFDDWVTWKVTRFQNGWMITDVP